MLKVGILDFTSVGLGTGGGLKAITNFNGNYPSPSL